MNAPTHGLSDDEFDSLLTFFGHDYEMAEAEAFDWARDLEPVVAGIVAEREEAATQRVVAAIEGLRPRGFDLTPTTLETVDPMFMYGYLRRHEEAWIAARDAALAPFRTDDAGLGGAQEGVEADSEPQGGILRALGRGVVGPEGQEAFRPSETKLARYGIKQEDA